MTADSDDLRTRLKELSTDELRAMIDRQDTDEWRPEVLDVARAILVGRGVFPVPRPKAALGEHSARDHEIVVPPEGAEPVARGFDLGETDDADKVLSAAGIPVQVIQTSKYGFWVFVPKDQQETAVRLLREAGLLPARDVSEPITLSGGPCPACAAAVPPGVGECPACGLAV